MMLYSSEMTEIISVTPKTNFIRWEASIWKKASGTTTTENTIAGGFVVYQTPSTEIFLLDTRWIRRRHRHGPLTERLRRQNYPITERTRVAAAAATATAVTITTATTRAAATITED